MPLDTANALMSALGALGPSLRMPPIPGVSTDLADRQHLSGTFAGLLAQGAEYTGSVAFAGGTGSLAVAGTFTAAGSGDIAFAGGSGVLTVAGTASYIGSTSFVAGPGILAVAGTASYARSLAFAGGAGSLTLAGTSVSAGSGAMAFTGGEGSLAVVGTASYAGPMAFAGGDGAVALIGVASYDGSIAFATGGGALTLAGTAEAGSVGAGLAFVGGPVALTVAGATSYAGSIAFAAGTGVLTVGTASILPVEPADSLLTAIWRFADADADLTATFGYEGWLWKNKAPGRASLPYAVVFGAGATPAKTGTGESYFQTILVQFNVFATTEVDCSQLGDLLIDTFAPYFGQEEMIFLGGEDRGRWIDNSMLPERDFGRGAGGVPVYVKRVVFGWRVWRSYAPD